MAVMPFIYGTWNIPELHGFAVLLPNPQASQLVQDSFQHVLQDGRLNACKHSHLISFELLLSL
jgi:hypothetical protein